MSVRKGDRGESELEVLNKMRELAEYTINTVRNEKNFPKAQRWILSQKIANECLDAMISIRAANSVWVTSEEDYKYRRKLQTEAHAHLGALLSLIDLAYLTLQLDCRKVEHWTRLVSATDDKLKAWMKAEKQRYKNGFEIISR